MLLCSAAEGVFRENLIVECHVLMILPFQTESRGTWPIIKNDHLSLQKESEQIVFFELVADG